MSHSPARGLSKRLLCMAAGLCLLAAQAAPAFAQRRTTAPARQPPPGSQTAMPRQAAAPRCQGGWSGVIKYTKTLKESGESEGKGVVVNSVKHKSSRDYVYAGTAVVDGSDPRNAVTRSRFSLDDAEHKSKETRNWDTCGNRGNTGRWQVTRSEDERQTQGRGEGALDAFHLGVNESGGTYSFSFRFPEGKGVEKRESHVRREGFCQPNNNQPSDRSTSDPVTVGMEGDQVEGVIDPRNPDVLTGTKTFDSSSAQVKSFVYRVTWRFTRCPQKLLITDYRFQHPKFPNIEDWRDVDPTAGTVDGNRVKIKASVLNLSGETKYATVKFAETYKGIALKESMPDEEVGEGPVSVRLEAGEEREVEVVWNTEGRAWHDYGAEHLLHNVRADLEEGGQVRDTRTEQLRIAPKPVVLVHGLWSNANAWIPLYQNLLTTSHSFQWKAFPVGERPEKGRLNTGGAFMSADKTSSIYENAEELAKYVRFAQEEVNAWHVDLVAHSMGGLISRLYVHKLMPDSADGAPLVKHLVMLGTPNGGSQCADVMDMKFRAFGERVQAVKELKPEEVALFNRHVRERKRVRFSALAGNSIPVMCKNVEWNDGVVSVSSAIKGVEDHAFSNDIHTDLTNARNFGNFVLPHLVTGPKGTYPLPVRSDPTPAESFENIEWGFLPGADSFDVRAGLDQDRSTAFGALFVSAAAPREVTAAPGPHAPQGDGPAAPFTHEVRLAPKQATEVEIPVAAGPNFGLTFMAAPAVSATLFNEEGAAVGRNTANRPRTNLFFRTIFVAGPVRGGVWKLRLENTAAAESVVLLATWADASPISLSVTAGPAPAAGQVTLRARLTNNNAPVTGATVRAAVRAQPASAREGVAPPPAGTAAAQAPAAGPFAALVLHDDGLHDDGVANDGVYAASVERLPPGDYVVEATAEAGGLTRAASAAFKAGAAAPVIRPPKGPANQARPARGRA